MKYRLAGALALGSAGLLIGGGTPYAADAGAYTGTRGGWAGWTENGDTLTVCDLSSDGHGVRGYIYPRFQRRPG
ncbi:hypothetical protein QA802_39310 [Streptomyces sp. B21-105]|uniref:hypothetical protein n=1 Tax=Streptomyces sp. B21-105 TaxID=3039417 RepID=UPI002FF1970A